jgi:hypothetical protein
MSPSYLYLYLQEVLMLFAKPLDLTYINATSIGAAPENLVRNSKLGQGCSTQLPIFILMRFTMRLAPGCRTYF